MSGVIATLLTSPKTINIVEEDQKGPSRHVYEELTDMQTINDPDLASPYLKATGLVTIPKHTDTITSGNFTITMNFPNYGVSVTTGNILWNSVEATIQTAVDAALAGEVILATYIAGHVTVALSGTLTTVTGNDATLEVQGTTVNGAYMSATTANVDLDADKLGTPVVTTPGTMDRPAEAVLTMFGAVVLTGSITPQGLNPEPGVYTESGDIVPLSPGLQEALVTELSVKENAVLGAHIRDVIGCV